MVPVVREVVVTQAWPAPSSVTVRLSPPGPVKVTVPVGVPEPGGLVVTVAQTSTDCPQTDGSGSAVTTVVVVCGVDHHGDGSRRAVVAVVAVVGGRDGAGREHVRRRQACPAASSATVWLSPPGPVKVTVPVGIPEPGALVVTFAQTSTDSPQTDGFGSTETRVVVSAGSTVTAALPTEPAKQGLSPL